MSRYIRAYATRVRNRLITLLGGDDPVTVQHLKYRAKLLAEMTEMVEILAEPHHSYRVLKVAKAQAHIIKQTLLHLDHAR